ncbi:MAG: hypothetical protein AAGK67_04195 [Pseudomonadota bacterium]
MESLFEKGFDLCFGDADTDPAAGRALLEDVATSWRHDAMYYIGLSYELEDRFDEADEAYLAAKNEDGRMYILAAYRSAILHWKQRVTYPDRDFCLRAFRQLATDKHWPSVAHYTVERLKGSYGLSGFVSGLMDFIPNLIRIFRAAFDDPDQDTIRMKRS